MKLVLFEMSPDGETLPGLLTERGVVDISSAVRKGYTPQLTMQGLSFTHRNLDSIRIY